MISWLYSVYASDCSLIINVPKAHILPVPKSYAHPKAITKLTLNKPAKNVKLPVKRPNMKGLSLILRSAWVWGPMTVRWIGSVTIRRSNLMQGHWRTNLRDQGGLGRFNLQPRLDKRTAARHLLKNSSLPFVGHISFQNYMRFNTVWKTTLNSKQKVQKKTVTSQWRRNGGKCIQFHLWSKVSNEANCSLLWHTKVRLCNELKPSLHVGYKL